MPLWRRRVSVSTPFANQTLNGSSAWVLYLSLSITSGRAGNSDYPPERPIHSLGVAYCAFGVSAAARPVPEAAISVPGVTMFAYRRLLNRS